MIGSLYLRQVDWEDPLVPGFYDIELRCNCCWLPPTPSNAVITCHAADTKIGQFLLSYALSYPSAKNGPRFTQGFYFCHILICIGFK